MAPRKPRLPKIVLPSGEIITPKEFEKFESTLQSVKKRAERWNTYVNELPSYFDQFSEQRPFAVSEFGEFRFSTIANASDLVGITNASSAYGERRTRRIQNREEFFNLQSAIERANTDTYIDEKLRRYIDNYIEALQNTYDKWEIAEIIDYLKAVSPEEFVRLANLYDLSIKYTVSGDEWNPYTGRKVADEQLQRLYEAFGIGPEI